MGNWITRRVAENLREPKSGLIGFFVTHKLKQHNLFLEKSAVELINPLPGQNILEVGFGPGYGLQALLKVMKDGEGSVCGVDMSEMMVASARKLLATEEKAGCVELKLGTVYKLPYPDQHFDAIYHVNCYYFWDDMEAATKELRRVLKDSGVVVTTLNQESLRASDQAGFMQCANTSVDRYVQGLEKQGFTRVEKREMDAPTPHLAVLAWIS